jgi:hypothetical protein
MDLADFLAQRVDLKMEIEADARRLANKRNQLIEIDGVIKDLLRETGLDSVSKAGYRATIVRAIGTRVNDWESFYQHVAASGDWHLLQKRLTQAPFAEMFEEGTGVPGVEIYEYDDLSVRKSSKSS